MTVEELVARLLDLSDDRHRQADELSSSGVPGQKVAAADLRDEARFLRDVADAFSTDDPDPVRRVVVKELAKDVWR